MCRTGRHQAERSFKVIQEANLFTVRFLQLVELGAAAKSYLLASQESFSNEIKMIGLRS
jgi:hypothetical protein